MVDTENAYRGDKPILYVEVSMKEQPDSSLISLLRQWLTGRYATQSEGLWVPLPTNEALQLDEDLKDNITSIRVYKPKSEDVFIDIRDYFLEMILYKPHTSFETTSLEDLIIGYQSEGAETLPRVRVTPLPSSTLDAAWQSLVFEPRIQEVIFNGLLRILCMKKSTCNHNLLKPYIPYMGVFLFEGPPGTGKTTLCKALAQKLSIRMRSHYSVTRLVELDPNVLYSKYFSESARLVGITLEAIGLLLDKEPGSLIIVLIDEIESLSCSREQSVSGTEPQDAMRAVNALLTGLDGLRTRPNLIVLCTSNLVEAMDSAFLDRVDFKWHIPGPCTRASYSILRQQLLNLQTEGWVYKSHPSEAATGAQAPGCDVAENELPELGTMLLRYSHQDDHPAKKLWEIAQQCTSLSGRNIQRLPMLALALHARNFPCSLNEVLVTLKEVVQTERHAKMHANL